MLDESPNPKVRHASAVYFVVQGIAVFAWWVVLLLAPATRHYFLLEPDSELSLMSFWLADIFLLGFGSLTAGWLCFSNNRYSSIATWFVTGSVSYATLYSFAFSLKTDIGWIGVILMFPAMVWSGVFSVGLSVGNEMFRHANESSTSWILTKTITQIVVVWSIILGVFPYLITIVEDRIGSPRVHFAFQHPISTVIFILISSLGVWAAVTMAKTGLGTPLPLDHAIRLVVQGPYSYVRNPMAVSGVGQGLAVALYLGSPLVAVYALMGSLIWQLVFRPLEERDLEERFGRDYLEYKRNVKCWVPRFPAYEISNTIDPSDSSLLPLERT